MTTPQWCFPEPMLTKAEVNIGNEHNGAKNPSEQRQTSWLVTTLVEELNSGRPRTTPANGQNGLEPAALQRVGHAASYEKHHLRWFAPVYAFCKLQKLTNNV